MVLLTIHKENCDWQKTWIIKTLSKRMHETHFHIFLFFFLLFFHATLSPMHARTHMHTHKIMQTNWALLFQHTWWWGELGNIGQLKLNDKPMQLCCNRWICTWNLLLLYCRNSFKQLWFVLWGRVQIFSLVWRHNNYTYICMLLSGSKFQ